MHNTRRQLNADCIHKHQNTTCFNSCLYRKTSAIIFK